MGLKTSLFDTPVLGLVLPLLLVILGQLGLLALYLRMWRKAMTTRSQATHKATLRRTA